MDLEFERQFKEFRVPFCSPMACVELGSEFVQDLGNVVSTGIDVGVVYREYDSSLSYMTRSGKVLLTGDCRFKECSDDDLTEIIQGFRRFDECRLFVIVVKKYLAKDVSYFEPDYCIWNVERVSIDGTRALRQVLLNTRQDKTARKHVILIPLATIHKQSFYCTVI